MAEPHIRIENLSKAFEDDQVLDKVSLDIERGESLVVIGQSGTGKSVLLKHIIKLLEPDSGTVMIDGADIGTMTAKELLTIRRRIGILFQSAALFDSMTVMQNVGLGLREAHENSEEEISRLCMEKLDMVGLADSADKYPAELSGGMRKRAGLARAIATSPEILLYDEPTTGLDPIMADMINDMIVELNKRLNVTSITVTHDMISAYKIASRVVMLYQGSVQFDGTPDQIRSTSDEAVRQFINGSSKGPIKVR